MSEAQQSTTAKRRGRPPKLSREQVLDAALRLLRRHGQGGVTMRAVAEALGVAPMSLYTHVRDKADLLVGVAGCALESLNLEVGKRPSWRDEIRAWANSLRRQLLAYPDVVSLLGARHWQSPQLLRAIHGPVRVLVEAGLPGAVAVEVVQAIVGAAFGFVLIEEGKRRHPRSGVPLPEEQLTAALNSMSGGERAQMRKLLPHLVTGDFDRVYDATVRRVVESLGAECYASLGGQAATACGTTTTKHGAPSGPPYWRESERNMKQRKSKEENVIWHPSSITKHDRERLNGHFGATLWLTGLSASGKSTLAHEVQDQLYNREIRAYVLDGDNIRHRLNRDLGFSPEDRKENIRRIGEVAHLFNEVGFIVLCAFISPYRADRRSARDLQDDGSFYEVFCRCPLEVCEQRDPKGLYKKARAGEIEEFTGISAPYEEPEEPELIVDTDRQTIKESAGSVIQFLEEKGIIVRPVVRPPRRIE